MSFSRETSAGYFTGEEGGQRIRHGPTASRATQLRVCPECGCCLEALSREIMDLKEDNRCLRCQLEKESMKHKEEVDHLLEEIYCLKAELATSRSKNEALQEFARRERYHRKELHQKLVDTNLQNREECDYLQEELYRLQAKLAACLSEKESLRVSVRQEQYHCMDLEQMLDKSNRKYREELNQFQKELYRIQKINTELEQQLSDSERRRERAERTMLTYKSLVLDITDEAEQLDGEVQQLQSSLKESQRSYKELRETTFRAFCKVRPSLLDLQIVMLQHIPNSRKNAHVWLEFLTALNMNDKDIPALLLSNCDAQWNVQKVLDAWRRGSGSEPKTWGTLLNGMHERGTPFLRELADTAENLYLRKLASLRLPFDVCCVCWKSFSPTIATECSELPVSQSSLCPPLISNV